ncbi:lysylphosphatidylglycerol synthase transmembrane domain-containing protein [Pyrococcus horikoshii]|uniref:UPF0104 membrane protein PH1989 n=2 Tax=Pyrococcus horikoshii TaxID=53953 RepID=Y1989_PYRHO|nr:lysylphosphatidylglycerol synthase transmembrane domain-containing protein [Pyrococcus horikoshii]O57713.1 RecName: Full=UPF0104 membrane protein PH1989 [Pyrococcus horikoshii OT3]BAA31116.1 335aa long hypothetical protein [Pyrococcus horikoshii OT3]HII61646.1 flippase-like domain-containing protein [Pyrococcus horikoshii]
MKKYLLIIIGVTLVLILLWWAGIERTIKLMMRADIRFILLAILMYCISVLIWAVRWNTFLKGANINVSFVKVIEGVFIGIFLNNLTPGARTGGEAVKVIFIKKASSNGSYSKVFATVIADRILDVIPVVVFMMLAFLYALTIHARVLLIILGISAIILVIILLMTTVFSIKEKYALSALLYLARIFRKIFPSKFSMSEDKIKEKLLGEIREFKETFLRLAKRKRRLSSTMLYSFILWGADILKTYFIFLSLGGRITFLQVLLVRMASIAVAMISVIPGGIGITEVVQSALFLAVGVEKALAVSVTMLDRLISFWIPTLLGGILVLKNRKLLVSSS